MDLTCAHLRDICKQNNIKISKKGKKLNKKQLINLLKKQSGGLKCSDINKPYMCFMNPRCIRGENNSGFVCKSKKKCSKGNYNKCSQCGSLAANCLTAKNSKKKCRKGNYNNCSQCGSFAANCLTAKKIKLTLLRKIYINNNTIQWKLGTNIKYKNINYNYHQNFEKKINFEGYAKIIYYLFPKLINEMQPEVQHSLQAFPKKFLIAYLELNRDILLKSLENNKSENIELEQLPDRLEQIYVTLSLQNMNMETGKLKPLNVDTNLLDYLIQTSLTIYSFLLQLSTTGKLEMPKKDDITNIIEKYKNTYEDEFKLTTQFLTQYY